ncbi:MAG: helix-turn-helix transcriptional regulator [Oceanococcaceae bacterium]
MLKERLSDKAFTERRRVTLNEVAERTGISRPTLNRIANIPGYNTNTDTINSLCDFFDCDPGELLVRVREE